MYMVTLAMPPLPERMLPAMVMLLEDPITSSSLMLFEILLFLTTMFLEKAIPRPPAVPKFPSMELPNI